MTETSKQLGASENKYLHEEITIKLKVQLYQGPKHWERDWSRRKLSPRSLQLYKLQNEEEYSQGYENLTYGQHFNACPYQLVFIASKRLWKVLRLVAQPVFSLRV